MSLLTPSFGLLFWMLISFGFVFFILAKFGFPVIVKMVDDRRDYIKQSIENADEANAKLEGIKVESETIINEAINRQNQLIKQATDEGNKLVQTAKEKASLEAQKQLEEGVKRLEVEKQKAIADIRIQVAELSVDIAEKILRKQLEDENSQQALIERFLDEVDNSDVLKN